MTVDELRALINDPSVRGDLVVMVPDDMALFGESSPDVARVSRPRFFIGSDKCEPDDPKANFFYIGPKGFNE